jgi:hypothetical protein
MTMTVLVPSDGPSDEGGHDAVVIMVPYNDETHYLVDAEFLARMPGGVPESEAEGGR